MTHFTELGLDPAIVHALNQMEFTEATPIQAKAIPLALEGRDVLGSAQTGTGKTAAFAIPLMSHLLNDASACALVLSPTREIAKQTMDMLRQLLKHNKDIGLAFLIGGESMGKQFAQLKRRPRVIVATPGRLNDHLERGSLKMNRTDFLVLDETDRMLDMGFAPQLEQIFPYLAEERQTLMFSATFPKKIVAMAETHMVNPERIAIGSTTSPHKNIKQTVVRVSQEAKFDKLVDELQMRVGTAIVFAKTKYGTEKLAKRLRGQELSAEAIHGDLKQSRRERVIRAFRQGEFRILVATDVVARGLDVPHVAHVVNFDLPQVAEDYIHRIGRTARAGAEGEALCLIAPQDNGKWAAIDRLINPNAKGGGSERDEGGRGYGRKSSKPAHRKGGGFKGGFKDKSNKSFRGGRKFDGPSQNDLEGRDGFRDSFNSSRNSEGRDENKRADRKPFREGRKFDGEARSDTRGGERKPFREGRKFDGEARSDTRGGERKPFREGRKFDGESRSDTRGGERKPFREGRKFDGESRSDTRGGERKPFREGRKFDGEARSDTRGGERKPFREGGKFKGGSKGSTDGESGLKRAGGKSNGKFVHRKGESTRGNEQDGYKSRANAPRGDRPSNGRPSNGRPSNGRPTGGRPNSRPGGKPQGGNRSGGNRRAA